MKGALNLTEWVSTLTKRDDASFLSHKWQSGFTMIELMLFLSISSLALLFALSSINSSINFTRFGDDNQSLESYLQTQYSAVEVGQNDRGTVSSCVVVSGYPVLNSSTTAVGTSGCVILGRLLTFDVGDTVADSDITSRYIVASGGDASGATETDRINSLHPLAIDNGATNKFSMPWGSELQTVNQNGTGMQAVAIVRGPESGRMIMYALPTANYTGSESLTFDATHLNNGLDVCLFDHDFIGGKHSFVKIDPGEGINNINVDQTYADGGCP